MDLQEFRNHVTAQRLAEIQKLRNNNRIAIMSVAIATILENHNERKTKNG